MRPAGPILPIRFARGQHHPRYSRPSRSFRAAGIATRSNSPEAPIGMATMSGIETLAENRCAPAAVFALGL